MTGTSAANRVANPVAREKRMKTVMTFFPKGHPLLAFDKTATLTTTFIPLIPKHCPYLVMKIC
jgi:hypothetical protein